MDESLLCMEKKFLHSTNNSLHILFSALEVLLISLLYLFSFLSSLLSEFACTGDEDHAGQCCPPAHRLCLFHQTERSHLPHATTEPWWPPQCAEDLVNTCHCQCSPELIDGCGEAPVLKVSSSSWSVTPSVITPLVSFQEGRETFFCLLNTILCCF